MTETSGKIVVTIHRIHFTVIPRKQLFYLVGFRVYLLKYNGIKSLGHPKTADNKNLAPFISNANGIFGKKKRIE